MRESDGRAIQILGSTNEQNALAMLFKIAASNPAAIVNAVDGSPAAKRAKATAHEMLRSKLEQRCLDMLNRGERISAIKEWRAATKVGLIEAKEAIERLAEREARCS